MHIYIEMLKLSTIHWPIMKGAMIAYAYHASNVGYFPDSWTFQTWITWLLF
jgi:hypothetical protein